MNVELVIYKTEAECRTLEIQQNIPILGTKKKIAAKFKKNGKSQRECSIITRELMSLPFLPRSLVTTTFGVELQLEVEEEEVAAWIVKAGTKIRRWSSGQEGEYGEEEREICAIGDVLRREDCRRTAITKFSNTRSHLLLLYYFWKLS